ncbi:MAG: glutathione S-transferase [Alphaproteobacteria bacterium]|nr:glutathione S-transferase [Alphaproteobacteria bacterium]
MKLYQSPTSPFARKVIVLLKETGQTDDVELVGAAGTPLNADNMPTAHNPLGKIPALEREDGPALFDSRVICQFLDARAGGVLYPAAPRRWDCLTLEAMADGIVDAAILMVYEARIRPADIQMEAWVEGQWRKVSRALDAIESSWGSYLAGPLDMGQIALGCALSYLDFRHKDRDWRAGHTGLAAWERAIAARDSMKATVPVE